MFPIFIMLQNGMIFGIFSTAPGVMFSGFFILYRDSPIFFQTMFDVSILRKATEAIMVTLYEDRKALQCNQVRKLK